MNTKPKPQPPRFSVNSEITLLSNFTLVFIDSLAPDPPPSHDGGDENEGEEDDGGDDHAEEDEED